MPVLDYKTLKAFMHPSLLDSFPETNGLPNATLEAAITVAIQSYNSLTASLPEKVRVRFDSITFMLKAAFVQIYTFILHDASYLTAITLTGLGLREDQVYDHFFALLQLERKDVDEMRKELLDEIDKDDSNHGGVVVYHRYPRRGGGS